jgi:UDP-2-acetamido-3-amino-2,3-dideoxy-glucuronate N-acetyltransferase
MTYLCISEDVKLGINVRLSKFINLYGCTIGDNTKIGSFVEIQKNAIVGKNCKISSHSFICEGVTIGDNCFIGHNVTFINDNYPRAVNLDAQLETEKDWLGRFVKTIIDNEVSIGSSATILGGVTIGSRSIIGAGSVVTKNIPPDQIWAGNPAKFIRRV